MIYKLTLINTIVRRPLLHNVPYVGRWQWLTSVITNEAAVMVKSVANKICYNCLFDRKCNRKQSKYSQKNIRFTEKNTKRSSQNQHCRLRLLCSTRHCREQVFREKCSFRGRHLFELMHLRKSVRGICVQIHSEC